MGSAHTHLSSAARCLDRSRHCPSRYVNKDQEESSWESRGPRLEAGFQVWLGRRRHRSWWVGTDRGWGFHPGPPAFRLL